MSRSGNQYAHTVEINNKLKGVHKNRKRLNGKIDRIIAKHKDEGWILIQDNRVPELYMNLRAKNVDNGIYRHVLLNYVDFGRSDRKQIIIRSWVLKSERIT